MLCELSSGFLLFAYESEGLLLPPPTQPVRTWRPGAGSQRLLPLLLLLRTWWLSAAYWVISSLLCYHPNTYIHTYDAPNTYIYPRFSSLPAACYGSPALAVPAYGFVWDLITFFIFPVIFSVEAPVPYSMGGASCGGPYYITSYCATYSTPAKINTRFSQQYFLFVFASYFTAPYIKAFAPWKHDIKKLYRIVKTEE